MNVFVIIPVHNRLDFTRACLASLREQRYRDFTIVVVDDGSTDGTHVALTTEFPEITLLWGDGDLWWTGSMNKGLEWVLPRAGERDYVLALNNDTALPPDYLETLLGIATQHPSALIGSVAVSWDDHERIVDGGVHVDWRTARFTALSDGLSWTECLERWGDMAMVSVLSGRGTLIPIEAFRRVGVYDQARLPHYGADWEFARRAQLGGFQLLMSYRARVLSRNGATRAQLGTPTMSWSKFLRAYVDIGSPNNLHCRWNFARLCVEPASFPAFLAADLARTVGGGLRRQVLGRCGCGRCAS